MVKRARKLQLVWCSPGGCKRPADQVEALGLRFGKTEDWPNGQLSLGLQACMVNVKNYWD
jgi:hypothetical protein